MRQLPCFLHQAIELGGKKQFPFLVDPNTGKQMYESDDIINYLFKVGQHGAGWAGLVGLLGRGQNDQLACMARRHCEGWRSCSSVQNAKPERSQ